MRIAVASDNNMVSGHFGHCEGFTIFEVEDNKIDDKKFLESPGHKPGFLPRFLAEQKIDVIIAGGMGAKAQSLFNENGIEVVVGASENTEDVVKSFLNGRLKSTGSVCTEHQHSGDCGGH